MKTQTFGIEIEMNHITRERAAQAVAATLGEGSTVRHTGGTYDAWEVTAPDGRRWKLVSDASIAGPRTHGTEFVSPICRWEDIGDLTVGFVGTMTSEYQSDGVKFIRSLNVHPFRHNHVDF